MRYLFTRSLRWLRELFEMIREEAVYGPHGEDYFHKVNREIEE
ncbi:hypothetical protein LCGC14_0485950 [marine sediment metagenome]|uniref:Uncharacterized protein n=1 Tax=marine sediment metagenome TaxID=412755 RepID=A0A0F9VGV4_9ZZZZ